MLLHENIFPFHTISTSNEIIDNFPNLVLLESVLNISTHGLTSDLAPDCSPPSEPITIPSATPVHPTLRRSLRNSRLPPSYFQDFHCNLLANSSVPQPYSQYLLSDYLTYTKSSRSHNTLLFNISLNFEPQFYHQAVKYDQWKDVMVNELAAMEGNKAWIVTSLPRGKHAIGCK